MFINAMGEYSEKDSPIRDICKQFKNLMRNHIRDLCVQASAEDLDALAYQLALILEGAIVTAQVSQNPDTAKKRTLCRFPLCPLWGLTTVTCS